MVGMACFPSKATEFVIMPSDLITDIWFRSGLSLPQIAEKLGLAEVDHDSENYWEWVIGNVRDVRIDITRTHTKRRASVDVRVFCLDLIAFDSELKTALVQSLSAFVRGPICCGRWRYRTDNDDFDVEIVESYPAK
jgi:hypothetical protein